MTTNPSEPTKPTAPVSNNHLCPHGNIRRKCYTCELEDMVDDLKLQVEAQSEKLKLAVEALQELNDIIQGYLDGEDIVIDSFTLQPAREVLAKIKESK